MPSYCKLVLTVCNSLKMRSHAYAEMCEDNANFRICGINSAYTILKTQLYVGKYAICGFCNILDRMCGRMFSYNRYAYNCASVQRALLAPEILNESFLKCRYFTALYPLFEVGVPYPQFSFTNDHFARLDSSTTRHF